MRAVKFSLRPTKSLGANLQKVLQNLRFIFKNISITFNFTGGEALALWPPDGKPMYEYMYLYSTLIMLLFIMSVHCICRYVLKARPATLTIV